ncbi:response regulator transcription factor [Streptomyces sp. NPDC054871]
MAQHNHDQKLPHGASRDGDFCSCQLAREPNELQPPVDILTERERQVLALLGGGLPNRTLARRLGIAERTVKAHVAHIIGKLGLESRLEAALIANVYHDLICPGRQSAN